MWFATSPRSFTDYTDFTDVQILQMYGIADLRNYWFTEEGCRLQIGTEWLGWYRFYGFTEYRSWSVLRSTSGYGWCRYTDYRLWDFLWCADYGNTDSGLRMLLITDAGITDGSSLVKSRKSPNKPQLIVCICWIRIYPHQSVSICINLYQSASIRINPYQSASIRINLYQSISIRINPTKAVSCRM